VAVPVHTLVKGQHGRVLETNMQISVWQRLTPILAQMMKPVKLPPNRVQTLTPKNKNDKKQKDGNLLLRVGAQHIDQLLSQQPGSGM